MEDIAFREQLKGFALDALALGVIVVDREGRLICANAAGDRILAARSGALRLSAGKVIMARGLAQAEFQASIARVCDPKSPDTAGEYILAAACGDAPDLAIRILPVPGPVASRQGADIVLMVRIIETTCNLEFEARRLFGLTKAQAKFASALASGSSLDEAARANAVSVATARSHMKTIFRKFGVSRQSQVAALLRGAQIPVEPTFASAEPEPEALTA